MGVPLTLLAADEIFRLEVFNRFHIQKTHRELLRYIQSVGNETKICKLSPLKRQIIVTKTLEINSNTQKQPPKVFFKKRCT